MSKHEHIWVLAGERASYREGRMFIVGQPQEWCTRCGALRWVTCNGAYRYRRPNPRAKA